MPETYTVRAADLALEVIAAGASVRRLTVGHGVQARDLILGFDHPGDYGQGIDYLGATIGRFGNRIDRGRLTVDGVAHHLDTNQFGNTLHGGTHGFDRRHWDVVEVAGDRITLELLSPDGDQGFPGEVRMSVTYRVHADGVDIDYRAQTDAPTVVNLTNHAYFDLDTAGADTIDDHLLTVAADRYLPVRTDLIPTGEVAEVTGSPFDLRAGQRISDVLADIADAPTGGLDHCFVLNADRSGPAARLVGRGGWALEIDTDLPGLQVYTGAHFDGSITGLGGTGYGPRAGIALETQAWPDSPNHPDFPSTLLRPGEVYRSQTRWRVGRA